MQTVTTIGLDIATSVFQVHSVDAGGQVVKPGHIARPTLTFEFFGSENSASIRALLQIVRQPSYPYSNPYRSLEFRQRAASSGDLLRRLYA